MPPRDRVESISVTELSGKLKDAVQTALKRNARAGFPKPEIRVLLNPGPIIGFIIRDYELGERKLADLSKVAADVSSQLEPLGGKSKAAVLVQDRKAIIGFLPRAALIEFRE